MLQQQNNVLQQAQTSSSLSAFSGLDKAGKTAANNTAASAGSLLVSSNTYLQM